MSQGLDFPLQQRMHAEMLAALGSARGLRHCCSELVLCVHQLLVALLYCQYLDSQSLLSSYILDDVEHLSYGGCPLMGVEQNMCLYSCSDKAVRTSV